MAESIFNTSNTSQWTQAPTDDSQPVDWASPDAWPTPHIRPASLEDLSQLTEALASSFYDRTGWLAWLYPLLRLGIQEDLKQRLKTERHHYACLAAVVPAATPASPGDLRPETIVGTVEVSQRQSWPWQPTRATHVYISNLAVVQPWRRRGVAAQLLAACEALAVTWHVDHLYLHVMEDNPGARRLYRRFGFEVLQVEEGLGAWLGLQPRRLLLQKDLVPSPNPAPSRPQPGSIPTH
ncbi:hypothetical protein GFS31_15290 [Leptolyngbya sp. BL0902]|uniref:GNAT family N-acetyltransferase n=1 Tax=Leptolyngbya sp. BL0902 TaxID=1115757 RepID=UPI0018E7A772|nr:GNAT family N-acetyltransferase [Leptolyngbya sp. BL0902]QQE64846.1 hypothetical protein GFS31_15290 [Leptolyngbya sp. BL0902]